MTRYVYIQYPNKEPIRTSIPKSITTISQLKEMIIESTNYKKNFMLMYNFQVLDDSFDLETIINQDNTVYITVIINNTSSSASSSSASSSSSKNSVKNNLPNRKYTFNEAKNAINGHFRGNYDEGIGSLLNVNMITENMSQKLYEYYLNKIIDNPNNSSINSYSKPARKYTLNEAIYQINSSNLSNTYLTTTNLIQFFRRKRLINDSMMHQLVNHYSNKIERNGKSSASSSSASSASFNRSNRGNSGNKKPSSNKRKEKSLAISSSASSASFNRSNRGNTIHKKASSNKYLSLKNAIKLINTEYKNKNYFTAIENLSKNKIINDNVAAQLYSHYINPE